MGNQAQHAEDEQAFGCQPQTWCLPEEEPAHCPNNVPCCQEGGVDRITFSEIRRLIRAGNSLAMDEDTSNDVVIAGTELTEQQAAVSKDKNNSARDGKTYARALSFASVESFGTVPMEHTAEEGDEGQQIVQPASPSSGSMWSLNSETHINVNMTVCEGVEEALRLLRTTKGLTEVPGKHDIPFRGFVEVGSLSESSSDQGFNAVSSVPENLIPTPPCNSMVTATTCSEVKAITARSCSDVVPISGG
mmetsp:Transcript_99422/g.192023  ORF Transcript_99422/g.192023 Transcript_99422/m.192023 type:complete len:247 (-) Transcript_99422:44-784(-)